MLGSDIPLLYIKYLAMYKYKCMLVSDIPLLYIKYLAMHKVQMHAG